MAQLSRPPPSPPEAPESRAALVRRIKSGIDKAFSQLLGVQELGRPSLLAHKKAVNRILDDFISV
jgi:hypothetical protein